MKICAAQNHPAPGNIPGNIEGHKKLINLAISKGAEVIIFPELSLTGYEPKLAAKLAVEPLDKRLDIFQIASIQNGVAIGIGIPTNHANKICISMIIFLPDHRRLVYSKKYLHHDEEEYFVPGENIPVFNFRETRIAPAICYEISVPDHARTADANGADIYIASVAKYAHQAEKALENLKEIANKYAIPVMMANSVGPSDGNKCAGQSSIVDNLGFVYDQLDQTSEGIIMLDTETWETSTYSL